MKKSPKKKPEKPVRRATLLLKKHGPMLKKLAKVHQISEDEVIQEAIVEKYHADLNV